MMYNGKKYELVEKEIHMSGENSFFGRAIDEDGNETIVTIWPKNDDFYFHKKCHAVVDAYDGYALYADEIDDENFEIVSAEW